MKKIKFIILFILLIFLVLFAFLFKGTKERKSNPRIILNGSKIVTISLGDKYKEEGFKAFDGETDITSLVEVKADINYEKEGTYEIVYSVKNKAGVLALNHRFIKILSKPYYKESYDNIDNTVRGWWSNNRKDFTRPSGGADVTELKKYNAYYIGPDEKIIYLTFDEGSLTTYVDKIVAVLDQNNVKGTFFLCDKYIVSNKQLIKKMVNNGHLIGNHTVNHISMPSLANKEKFNEYLYEIKKVEEDYYNIVGKEMEKVYRDPKGEWSFRDLQIIKDLGYKNYFYSAYYMDYGDDVSAEYALDELMKRYHNGAIYLLHPKNKGNYLALDSFIKKMKNLGFRFDIVKNIP